MSFILQGEEFDTRLFAVSGFAMLFVLTIILALTPPASGYEMSIYDAYPLPFWLLACLALLVGNFVIVRSASEETYDWIYGLVLVLGVAAVLTFLPFFRGYAVFGRADVLSHVGFIVDIQKTGGIGVENIYPNIHLLVLSLSYATGLDPSTVLMSIAGLTSLFGILSVLALLMVTFGRRRALYSIPFATVLIGVQSVPFLMSALLLPFVLYLFAKERQTKGIHVRAALAVALFSLVLYHPITTTFLLLVFGLYGVARLVRRLNVFRADGEQVYDPVGSMPLSQIMIAVFAVWYLDFPKIVERMEILVENTLFEAGSDAPIDTYGDTVSQYSPDVLDLLRITALRYGPSTILLTIGGLFGLYLLAAAYSRREDADIFELTFIGGLGLFAVASVAFLLLDLLVGFGRPLLFANIFGALLAGSLFALLSRHEVIRPVVHGALYVTLAVLIVVSTFGLYAAPAQIGTNHQVTQSELDGTEWYLEHRNDDIRLSEFGIDTYRFRDAIYGRYTFGPDNVVAADTTPIPVHFNYTERETLGASYERDHYLVLTTEGKRFYEDVYPGYPEFWGFEPADFERLPQDETVSQIYSSGDYEVYLVNSTA